MLGEDHSLVNEFPNLIDKITALNRTEESFATDAKRYHLLDTEIRKLELNSAPIDDEALHLLKHERVILKDSLYQSLTNQNSV